MFPGVTGGFFGLLFLVLFVLCLVAARAIWFLEGRLFSVRVQRPLTALLAVIGVQSLLYAWSHYAGPDAFGILGWLGNMINTLPPVLERHIGLIGLFVTNIVPLVVGSLVFKKISVAVAPKVAIVRCAMYAAATCFPAVFIGLVLDRLLAGLIHLPKNADVLGFALFETGVAAVFVIGGFFVFLLPKLRLESLSTEAGKN